MSAANTNVTKTLPAGFSLELTSFEAPRINNHLATPLAKSSGSSLGNLTQRPICGTCKNEISGVVVTLMCCELNVHHFDFCKHTFKNCNRERSNPRYVKVGGGADDNGLHGKVDSVAKLRTGLLNGDASKSNPKASSDTQMVLMNDAKFSPKTPSAPQEHFECSFFDKLEEVTSKMHTYFQTSPKPEDFEEHLDFLLYKSYGERVDDICTAKGHILNEILTELTAR